MFYAVKTLHVHCKSHILVRLAWRVQLKCLSCTTWWILLSLDVSIESTQPASGTKVAKLGPQRNGKAPKKNLVKPHVSSLLRWLMEFEWLWTWVMQKNEVSSVPSYVNENCFYFILLFAPVAYILTFRNTLEEKVTFYTVKASLLEWVIFWNENAI